MKYIKKGIMILVVVFVGIQFVPTTRNQSDVVPKTDFMLVNSVPNRIASKIKTSCYDCHSNNTNYPWYNTIQPIAWILEDHIIEGKKELNFSEWGKYSDRRKKGKLKSIINQIKDDEMPLASYTFMHGEAKLSDHDKISIIEWMNIVRDSL